jgi:prevent-host-death family protein
MEQVSIEAARRTLGEIIDRARLADQPTLITRQGKPAAVVISVERYEQAMALASEGSAGGAL